MPPKNLTAYRRIAAVLHQAQRQIDRACLSDANPEDCKHAAAQAVVQLNSAVNELQAISQD